MRTCSKNFHNLCSVRSFTVEETIDILLKRGADPNASSLPLTPLVYAIRSGDVQAVERLAERGADVNQTLPLQVGHNIAA